MFVNVSHIFVVFIELNILGYSCLKAVHTGRVYAIILSSCTWDMVSCLRPKTHIQNDRCNCFWSKLLCCHSCLSAGRGSLLLGTFFRVWNGATLRRCQVGTLSEAFVNYTPASSACSWRAPLLFLGSHRGFVRTSQFKQASPLRLPFPFAGNFWGLYATLGCYYYYVNVTCYNAFDKILNNYQ